MFVIYNIIISNFVDVLRTVSSVLSPETNEKITDPGSRHRGYDYGEQDAACTGSTGMGNHHHRPG
jgi:hypothetical protein